MLLRQHSGPLCQLSVNDDSDCKDVHLEIDDDFVVLSDDNLVGTDQFGNFCKTPGEEKTQVPLPKASKFCSWASEILSL